MNVIIFVGLFLLGILFGAGIVVFWYAKSLLPIATRSWTYKDDGFSSQSDLEDQYYRHQDSKPVK